MPVLRTPVLPPIAISYQFLYYIINTNIVHRFCGRESFDTILDLPIRSIALRIRRAVKADDAGAEGGREMERSGIPADHDRRVSQNPRQLAQVRSRCALIANCGGPRLLARPPDHGRLRSRALVHLF